MHSVYRQLLSLLFRWLLSVGHHLFTSPTVTSETTWRSTDCIQIHFPYPELTSILLCELLCAEVTRTIMWLCEEVTLIILCDWVTRTRSCVATDIDLSSSRRSARCDVLIKDALIGVLWCTFSYQYNWLY